MLNNYSTADLKQEIQKSEIIRRKKLDLREVRESLYFLNDNLKIGLHSKIKIAPNNYGLITPLLYELIIKSIEQSFNEGDLLQRLEPEIREHLQAYYDKLVKEIEDLEGVQ